MFHGLIGFLVFIVWLFFPFSHVFRFFLGGGGGGGGGCGLSFFFSLEVRV